MKNLTQQFQETRKEFEAILNVLALVEVKMSKRGRKTQILTDEFEEANGNYQVVLSDLRKIEDELFWDMVSKTMNVIKPLITNYKIVENKDGEAFSDGVNIKGFDRVIKIDKFSQFRDGNLQYRFSPNKLRMKVLGREGFIPPTIMELLLDVDKPNLEELQSFVNKLEV